MRKILGDTRLMLKCSVMYYENEIGQSEIAKKLGISRPTVSKLLKEAKERGYLRIQVVGPEKQDCHQLEKELEVRFGIKEAIVVPDNYDEEFQKEELGLEVMKYLYRMIEEHDVIGISMGTTLKTLPRYASINKFNNIQFIPLTGGIGQSDITTHSNQLVIELSKKMGGSFKFLHGPAVVSNENIIKILKEDKNIKEIFELMEKINIAVVGIGNPIYHKSTVIKTGYFTEKDMEELKEKNAVGDICLNIYDKNGSIHNYQYNKRIFGINIEKLKKIDKVVGIACGIEKVDAVKAALKGKYINVLAINYSLAEMLLK